MARDDDGTGGAWPLPVFPKKLFCPFDFTCVLRQIASKKQLRKMSGVIIDD